MAVLGLLAFCCSTASAGLITLEFEGKVDFATAPDDDITLTLDLDSNTGAVLGGVYNRPPNGSIFSESVVANLSSVVGLNTGTLSFNITLANNSFVRFNLTSSGVLDSWDLSGWNNFGVPSDIVNAQYNQDFNNGTIQLVSAVPEPTSMLMVGSVMLGLCSIRRRK